MKKRNIIIISVSVITLLFGGLVSLAITTFPELVEVEKEKIEQSHEDVLFEAPSKEEIKANNEEVVLTSSQGEEATYVARTSDISAPISRHSFKGGVEVNITKDINISHVSRDKSFQEVEALEVSNNHADYYMGASYSSRSSRGSDRPIINKEQKQEVKRVPVDSNAIMNTTLMAIGLVEVLSIVLVMKRKRHLRIR